MHFLDHKRKKSIVWMAEILMAIVKHLLLSINFRSHRSVQIVCSANKPYLLFVLFPNQAGMLPVKMAKVCKLLSTVEYKVSKIYMYRFTIQQRAQDTILGYSTAKGEG